MSENGNGKVSFETIKAEIKDFGRNNFIEVAKKKATNEDGESNEFLSITRGYYAQDGTKKYKKSLTIPDDAETREFVAEMIRTL